MMTRSLGFLLTTFLFIDLTQAAATAAIPRISTLQPARTHPQGVLAHSSNSAVVITGVRINRVATGIEVVLETATSEALQATTRSEGNNAIADINNAQLRLPSGNFFRQDNPAAGIASVTVTNSDANSIRVTVIGDTAPQVELYDSDTALIVSFTTTGTPEAEPSAEEPIEIVVTATRTEEELTNVPRSVTIITREQIEEQTAASRDLQDLLSRTVPGYGASSRRAFSNSTTLRGRTPLVLIDGTPQSTNDRSFGRELRTIDPASIERIEVVRGPSAIYGQGATGGVINIITRQADEQRLSSTVEVGVDAALGNLEAESFGNYLEYGLSINEDDVDLLVTLSRDDAGVSFDAQGDRLATVQGTDESETFNIFGKLGWDIAAQQRLQLSVNHYNTQRDTNAITDTSIDEIPGIQKARAIVFDEGIEYIDASPQLDRNTLVSLSYTHANLLGSQVGLQTYYRTNNVQSDPRDRRSRDQGIYQGFGEFETWGGRLQIETPINPALSLLWGADYANEENFDGRNLFDPNDYDNSGGRIYRKINELTIVPRYQLSSLGLFAQLQWDVNERVALSGGLRHERIGVSVDDYTPLFDSNFDPYSGSPVQGGEQDFSDTVFNAAVLYRATDEISLFANFAQGFSVPAFSDVLLAPPADFDFSTSVSDLQPQKVNSYELGVRGNWNSLQLSLAGFYNQSDLGSTLVDLDGDNFYETVRAPERVYGIEVSLDWQATRDWRLGSTLTWSEGEADIEDNDNYLALSTFRIQPIKLTAYVEHQTTPGWRNRLQALFVGTRDRAFTDGIDLAPVSDSYLVVDYISSIQLGAGTLSIGIENLLNNQYYPAYDQSLRIDGFDSFLSPANGRTISLRYRVSW